MSHHSTHQHIDSHVNLAYFFGKNMYSIQTLWSCYSCMMYHIWCSFLFNDTMGACCRIFSQNTRMECQFFFRTRDAFRFPRMNRLFRIICIIDVLVFLTAKYKNGVALVVFGPRWNAAVAAASQHFKVNSAAVSIMQTIQFQILAVTIYLFIIVKLLSPVALNLFWNPRRRAELVWSPLFAILLLGPCLYLETAIPKGKLHMPRIFFIPLLAAALVVTISKLKFRRITMLVNSPTGRKVLCMRPAILIILMFAAIVILWNISENPGYFMAIFLFYALVIESFGNLQIPAACARVVLGLLALVKIQYGKSNFATGTSEDTQKNFILSRRLFYIMVLLEGALCIVACIAEIFSSIPRKLLVHRSGLRNWWGEKCIDMYYSYIFEQYIARGVLAPRIMQLTSFAMDLTNSTSDGNQLCGVRMLHSFLQREPSKTLLLSRLSTSTKTVHTLINILGWASPEDAVIRLYSAKVINDLAKTLQVDAIHGSMQNISSLLGTDNRLERQNPLLYTYDSQDGRRDTILDTGDNQEHRQDPSLHTSNRENSRILGCWQWMKKYCSIQETCTDQYLLPVLGMSILEMLADCDPGNCVEISRTADLISKIIGYTSKTQEKILKESSLKLMRRLSNTGGEIGVTLRKKMTEHPFLLKNLADVLDDIEGTQELRKLATEILRNLAVDRNTRQEIGRIGEITSRLLHAFLAWHAPSSDRSLQIISGQALAFSAMESVNNCSVMLKEPGYAFIQKLTAMIQDDRYNRYVAASILRNLCLHARPKLSNSDLAELSHFVRKVSPANSSNMFKTLEVCNVIYHLHSSCDLYFP